MRIGFTGTRQGMSERQLQVARELLFALQQAAGCAGILLIHGACRGADVEMDEIARVLGVSREIHPSTSPTRVRCELIRAGTVLTLAQPLPPLERDRNIVERCELLIAAPLTTMEKIRSGSWTTVRYARKLGRPVVVLDR